MNYLEEYGRGIDIVFTKMNEWELLPPIFKNSSNSFKVILPGKKLSKLNERQLKIWEYLLDNQKITRREIEVILPNIPKQTISHDLSLMKKNGFIHQEGKSVNTYYETNF